jgi:hypothetical protein
VETTFKDFDTVYHVGVTKPVVTWQPNGSSANFDIKVHGSATTNSVLPNVVFDVDQNVTMNFDSGSGQLWLAPGSLKVTVHVSGLGHAEIANAIAPRVSAEVKSRVALACSQAQPELDAMTARTQVLIEQLRTLDANADAQINQAQFVADGIVLRGDIFLTSRRAPVVQSKKTAEEDGHTAFQSWIPGGRIDSFEWSWTWSGASTPPGKATRDDRFLLRRPRAQTGRWGVSVALTTPVPGIDGWGVVCLRIKGVRIDATTGRQHAADLCRSDLEFGDRAGVEARLATMRKVRRGAGLAGVVPRRKVGGRRPAPAGRGRTFCERNRHRSVRERRRARRMVAGTWDAKRVGFA